jgi:hypothetical protein
LNQWKLSRAIPASRKMESTGECCRPMAVFVKKRSEFGALGLGADARTFSSNDFELTEVLACREERVAQPHSSECDANGCDQRAGFKFENKEESF